MKPANPKPLLAAVLLATAAAASNAAPARPGEPGVRNDRLAQVVQALRDGGRRAGGQAEAVAATGPGHWLTFLAGPVLLAGCLRRGS